MYELVYAGFWIRVVAFIIDFILITIITSPLLRMIYGEDYHPKDASLTGLWEVILNIVFPAIATIVFWIYKSATPGKMALRLKIVDATTGEQPAHGQFLVRYLGYFISLIPLFLGVIWVGIDERKQGWHDKLANTVVIRQKQKPVEFKG